MRKKKSWKTTLAGIAVLAASIAVPFVQNKETREALVVLVGAATSTGLIAAKDDAKEQ